MSESNRSHIVLASVVVSIGIAAAGYFVGQTLYNSKVGINTAEVKGLAERRVEADRAFWRIQYTVSGQERDAIAALYEESKEHQARIVALLL